VASSHGAWILLLIFGRAVQLTRRLMIAMLLVLVSLPVASARGQVSGDLLADPMGSPWLTRALRDKVTPSVVEWIEIENAHEAYLETFKILQEGELARYRAFVENSMSGVPDGQTIRAFVRKLNGARRLIESSDAVLFSEIEQILDEPKRASLARVRNLRALERLTVSYGTSVANRAVPLWSLVEQWEADLPPDQRELVSPILAAYERDLVSALKVWRKAQDQVSVTLSDELNRRGIDRIDLSDSDSSDTRAFQEALRAARMKMTASSSAVSRLNDRLVGSLRGLVSPLSQRRIASAHTQLLSGGRVSADPERFVSTLERMLAVDELPDSVRDELLESFTQYAVVDDRHVRGMIDLIEEDAPDRERLASFDDVRNDLARQFRERIDQIAIRSQREDLFIISRSGGLRQRDDSNERSSENLPVDDVLSTGRGGAGHFISPPISRRRFEMIAEGLVPESWQRAIIDTIYSDYLQAWRARVEPLADACDNAVSNVYRYDSSDPRSVTMDMGQLRESYRYAALACTELRGVDATFFESLASTCTDGQVDFIGRLTCARSIEGLLRGTDTLFRPREVAFSRPNIMDELEKIDLSPRESEAVAAVLDARAPAMLEAGRAARDIRMEVEFENHRLNNEMSRRMAESDATSAEYGLAFRDLSGRMATKHGSAMQGWFDMESAFRESIRAVLTEENRGIFDDVWKRSSNPMVYRTSEGVEAVLQKAMELDDLTDDQSVALSQVLEDHRSDWNAISDEMADLNLMLRSFGALSDEDAYENWRVLERNFSRLEFERREVDMRALRRLGLYLNDGQRERFPSLRDFDEASSD